MRIQYLEEVLKVNPRNEAARKDLVRLTQKMHVPPETQAKIAQARAARTIAQKKPNRLRLILLVSIILVLLGVGAYMLIAAGLIPWPII